MFSLEPSIAAWRQNLLAAGIQSTATLEELEEHLREEIKQQELGGADPEKAFASAVQKIGQLDTLKTEFTKMEIAENSLHWEHWVAGFISCGVIIPLGLYIVFKNEMSPLWRLAGLANFAVVALSTIGWRRLNRIFPIIPNPRTRLTIGLALGALGMAGMGIFANFILPYCEFTEGQLGVVILWGLTVMAAFGGIASGLEEAARKQNSAIN